MDNTTIATTTEKYDETAYAALIACQAINVAILGLSLYLSACVVVYGWKTKSWKKHHVSGMDRGTIYTICLVAMLSDVPRLVLVEIVFNVKAIPGAIEHCEEIMDATIVAYYIGIFPKYIFLWYRQHTINSHPSSVRLFSAKWMKIASYSVLVVMTIIVILLAYFYTTYSFTKSPLGCIFIAFEEPPDSIMTNAIARDYIIASGFILIEFMLLFLFVFPLFRGYQSKRKLQKQSSKGMPCQRPPSEKKHKDSLTSLMQRSTISAAIVVAIDIAVMVIAIYTPPDRPAAVLLVTYNVRNAIHAICVLSSFVLFKDILTVFCNGMIGSEKFAKQKEQTVATIDNDKC